MPPADLLAAARASGSQYETSERWQRGLMPRFQPKIAESKIARSDRRKVIVQLLEDSRPHLLTVAEYMTADIQGRTELIGGVVYDVSPRNEPHRYAVRMLTKFLVQGLAPAYAVQTQDAVAVMGWHGKDAPEIDVAVIAARYYDPMPTSDDAFAFIEVSDTTYGDDRRVKIPLYVNAGVPAWIVNIPKRRVEHYADAADLELAHGRVFGVGETIEILGVPIAIAELFPPEAFATGHPGNVGESVRGRVR